MQIEIRNMIDFTPFPLSIFDSKGKLVTANSIWRMIFGMKEDREYKIDDLDFLTSSGIEINVKKLLKSREAIRSRPVLFESDSLKISRKGRTRYYSFYINKLKDAEKNKYLMILALDVTEEINRDELNIELAKMMQSSAYMLEVLENERKRIAKDLHDAIGQKLVVAKLNLEFFQKHHEEKIEEIEKTKLHIQEISKDIKMIIQNLHPVVIDKYTLADAINIFIQNFMLETGIQVSAQFYGKYLLENKNINLNIYRIVQESLNNAAKHSMAKNINIELHFSDETITGMIKDNGKGFREEILNDEKNNSTGYGIISMRERTRACGGDFTIESKPREGTKIIFHVPLRGN